MENFQKFHFHPENDLFFKFLVIVGTKKGGLGGLGTNLGTKKCGLGTNQGTKK